MSSFETALAFTLKSEGGYVDNPADSGGATNQGITQHTYDGYRDSLKLPRRSVLEIEAAEVHDIYLEMYWAPAHCDGLSSALACAHFDWAVNHGVTGAIKTMQQACEVTPDGVWGVHTQTAVSALDTGGLWKAYNWIRLTWYDSRVQSDPSQAVFLAGWKARVAALDSLCEQLSENEPQDP